VWRRGGISILGDNFKRLGCSDPEGALQDCGYYCQHEASDLWALYPVFIGFAGATTPGEEEETTLGLGNVGYNSLFFVLMKK
jgi:hypothetical protein